MARADPLPAFNAFESQLKTLCLKEFPCGLGNWRSLDKKKKGHLSKTAQLDERYCVTVKDYGANYEKAETLEELVVTKTSPWNLDYSWSNEAKSLREIAVRSPWLIDERFVLSHFKTLRIIDRKVTDVDRNFLYFVNLEELTLTANYLRAVNSNHLPAKLKVLELCANQISNLADLCIQPPPLIHLGLGHNKLHMIDDYITGMYWPCLLSLDLSHNNLSDLLDIIRKLQTLPKLRNLLLRGNPLSLVPAYKGYTIDSLRKLEFLDDIPISADDRHKYKGLAKRKEFILDEAKLTFKVDFIKGVPMPVEMQFPEDQPEYPVVTRKYFLQFLFLEDSDSNNELFQMMQDPQQLMTQSNDQFMSERQSVSSNVLNATEEKTEKGSQPPEGAGSIRNVNFAQEVETVHDSSLLASQQIDDTVDNASQIESQQGGKDQSLAHTEAEDANSTAAPSSVHLPEPGEVGMELVPPEVPIIAINSGTALWEDDTIELDWWQVYTRDDLLGLRNFLRKGMDIQIMEEKVLSYPAEPEDSANPSPDAGEKGKAKKDEKKKDAKPDKPKDDKKKKGKKGEPEVELQHMPPEYTKLASFHIELEDFLENENEFETIFIEGGETRSVHSPVPSESPSKKNEKDKKKDKKKPDTAKAGKVDKGGKKSPDKKGGKGDKKGAPSPPDGGEDGPPPPPPPLEVHVAVRLHQWKTAIDSLKEDEPSQAPEQPEPVPEPTGKTKK